jgi:hypothetical protein
MWERAEFAEHKQAIGIWIETALTLALKMGWVLVALCCILTCLIMRKYQTKKLKLFFQPTNKIYQKFVSETDIKTMRYKPWFAAITATGQTMFLPLLQLIWQWKGHIKYRSEIFECADGGTILLEWLIHPTDKPKFES